MTAIAELVNTTKTYFCLDCGVCTGSCPVARVFPEFSPRQIIERSLAHTCCRLANREHQVGMEIVIDTERVRNRLITGHGCNCRIPDMVYGFISRV